MRGGSEERYWYFVTGKDMGNTMVLCPRTPLHMADGEPGDIRICVAPTAAHCLSAVNVMSGDVYIYRTTQRVKANKPYRVPDSSMTKEHWIVRSTPFERVTQIDIRGVNWADGARGGTVSSYYYTEQRRNKRSIMSFLKRRDSRLCTIKSADDKFFL